MKYILIAVLLLTITFSLSAQAVVIANKSVSESSINSTKLESIYSLEENRWSDGAEIKVFDIQEDIDAKISFYNYFNTTPKKMKKIWLRAKLSGDGIPPDQVMSEVEMLSKVASTPGAIGYISKENVNDTVKILATIN